MLDPRWRKVVGDLKLNRTRTTLVILSIALGIVSVGMISSTQVILSRDMLSAYLASEPHHALLLVDPFGEQVVKAAAHTPGVDKALGRRNATLRLRVGPDEWQELELIMMSSFRDLPINRLRFLDGALPPRRQQILMERASLDYLDAEIGDILEVQGYNGLIRDLEIVGQVHDVNQVTTLFSQDVQGYINHETLTSLGGTRDFNELLITVSESADDPDHILAVAQQVQNKLESAGYEVHGISVPDPGEHWAYDNTQAMLFLLSVLGILALILSGFLVVNTMAALVTQQIREIGIMKAVGARTYQLVGIYLGTVFIYGCIALVVAIPVSAIGAAALTNFVGRLLNFDIVSFVVTGNVLGLEVAIGLLVPLCAALFPVLSGTRITVNRAINSYGIGSGHYGRSLLDRAINAIRRLPRPTLLSLRNTFRRKGRLALVLATLTLASAIFISVLSVRDSLLLTLDDALRYWQYDIEVRFSRSYRIDRLIDEASQVPGVVEAEGWGFRAVTRPLGDAEQSDPFLMIALPAQTELIDPILVEGRWLLPHDDNAMVINTDLLKEEADLRVGDEVTVDINGRESTWRIVGLVQQSLAGPFAYVNYPGFAYTVRDVGKVNNIRIVTAEHDGSAQRDMAKALEAHFTQNGYQVNLTRTTTQEREAVENALNIIVIFLMLMAVLLAIVGGLGLMGTMGINVLERTREIGVLRAIGASHGSVIQIVVIEGVIIGFLGWVIGGGLAWPLGKLLNDQVGMLFLGAPGAYIFSVPGSFLWLGLLTLISVIASILPAWRAAQISVRESLTYQ